MLVRKQSYRTPGAAGSVLSWLRARAAMLLIASLMLTAANASVAASRAFKTIDLALLEEAVITFATTEAAGFGTATARVVGLDPRLRLAECNRAVETFWPSGAALIGSTTVGVRCRGTAPWKIYVPVKVSVRAPVLVTTRSIARGEKLDERALRVEVRDVSEARRGYLGPDTAYLHHVTRRALRAGDIVGTGVLEAPQLIKRGERVRVTVGSGPVRIQMEGIAMESGGLGHTIKIRNTATDRIIEGRVAGAGRITVRL